MITKLELDKLAQQYETEIFIKDDPILFIHRFKDKKDIELAGFIASLVAYGSRKQFIKKLEQLFEIAQNEPLNFIQNFEPELIGDFNYRFGKPNDFIAIFEILKRLYNSSDGLEELFEHGYNQGKIFETVVDYFYASVDKNLKPGQGFYHMIPNPHNGGAMKRMCMYLRWMVRKSKVDVGIWEFMKPSELYIPLDVHVGRISREMGLLTRNSNDFKAVIELTENLKKFCPEDPIKYDFALFGYGVNNN
ncbi:MAG: TIGR02757 family protein [Muribaculaceae bacterium]|nr:TIGR02757 family protein [Muribaculaceae bacterium]